MCLVCCSHNFETEIWQICDSSHVVVCMNIHLTVI